jgi:hypothetical protein
VATNIVIKLLTRQNKIARNIICEVLIFMGYDAMFPDNIVSYLKQSKHPRKLPDDTASYPRTETTATMQQQPENSQTNSSL